MKPLTDFYIAFLTCFWSLPLVVFQSHKTFHVEDATRTHNSTGYFIHGFEFVPVLAEENMASLGHGVNRKLCTLIGGQRAENLRTTLSLNVQNSIRFCMHWATRDAKTNFWP